MCVLVVHETANMYTTPRDSAVAVFDTTRYSVDWRHGDVANHPTVILLLQCFIQLDSLSTEDTTMSLNTPSPSRDSAVAVFDITR